ncbi:hypothetical protein M8013_00590 [Enterobacteriaceae bacterium H4N4]|uniref:Lysozyme inhibitor n=1 Tax=Silvania confinis TaxID=2926470 RepID=A0A9J6QAG9_9ENTR|nr:hypothetical protein [Silvania confinis]MCU6667259.1 hypothetical protein [Silvania confinis]
MRLIKVIFVLLLICSFSVSSKKTTEYSDSYYKCVSENVDNPMSTNCMDSEIYIQRKYVKVITSEHEGLISPEDGEVIDLNYYTMQQLKHIDDKCKLWIKSGGQNGNILEKQCALDETISLKKLLSNFVVVVEG